MGVRYNNRKWKESMRLRLDYNNMMAEFVGNKEGFTRKEIRANMNVIDTAYNLAQLKRGRAMMGWTELPYNQDEVVADIITTAREVRKNCDYFVVLRTYETNTYTVSRPHGGISGALPPSP